MGFIIFGVIALIIAVILVFVARGQQRRLATMSAAETYTAELLGELHQRIVPTLGAEALQQQCELAGTIECDKPLTAPLSGTRCVAYTQRVTREYEEEVTETDDKGRRTTRTRRGSETVESHDKHVTFWVRDSTGRTAVDPRGAELDLPETEERFEKASDGRGRRRTLGYRHEEHALAVGKQVYILGYAVDCQGQPRVARHPRDDKARFLISWRSEQELMRSAASGQRTANLGALGLGILGVVLVVIGLVS